MYKEKKCEMVNCTAIFVPTSGSQKYCNNCKDKAKDDRERIQWRKYNRKNNDYKEITKTCKFCDTEFSTYYKNKLYCGSAECESRRVSINTVNAEKRRSEKNKKKTKLRKVEKRTNDLLIVTEYLEDNDYKVINTDNYINSHIGTINVICPEGHRWETTFHNFKDNKNRCMVCYLKNNYTSKLELCIRDYFESYFPDINIIYNDRVQIKPKELDLYFPKEKLAIELCGLYWHGENSTNKPRNYHYKKMVTCEKKGIRLITVFEDEIYNKFKLVISRIKQALGITKNIIYARKCIVKEIDSKTANTFFIANHLQGSSTAKKRWGLFYDDELVSVCSVGSIIRKHTVTDNVLELKRLCFLPNTAVVGGASKLFKQVIKFAKEENYDCIRSYCDMRYANVFNPIYEILGFKLITSTKYTPHYFKQGKRYRNYSLRKTPVERLTGKTEYQLRLEQGYDRIWDCGHRTYRYDLTNHSNK